MHPSCPGAFYETAYLEASAEGPGAAAQNDGARTSSPGLGLVFFAENVPPARRRRRLALAALLLLAAASLVWPVYPFFSGVYPMLFGLPLSLAWPTFWLVVVFAALLWLYLSEP